MQSTPSPSATALVIGLDVCQSLFELKMFVDHKSSVANADILNRARGILQTHEHPGDDTSLNRYASKSWRLSPSTKPFTAVIVPAVKPKRVAWKRCSRGSRSASSDELTLTQTLELLQAADSMLLVEYLEVAIPIVNAVYVSITSQLKSAVYDPKLAGFYMQPAALRAAMGSVLLYVTLQGVTLVGMCLTMRVRYQLPALTLLSFVLEDHAWSIQGKMLAWLPGLFAFSVVHYGIDFTFQFDYSNYTTP